MLTVATEDQERIAKLMEVSDAIGEATYKEFIELIGNLIAVHIPAEKEVDDLIIAGITLILRGCRARKN